ncbi:TPA: LamG domain-containing protein [bacterium]|nr:LamG domain-containing protein [bacterium]
MTTTRFFAFIFLFFTLISYSQAKSVEVYFPFGDILGTILRDHSGNSNSAYIKGNPIIVSGRFGKALQFDGVDDFIILPHKDKYYLGKSNSYSLTLWIRHNPNGKQQIIIQKLDSSYPFKVEIQPDNKLSFSISDGTNTPKVSIDNISEKWHHCCFVRDVSNDRLYIYLDGKLSAEVEDTTEAEINNKSDITISVFGDAGFQGIIDEFALYDRVLTKDEIKKASKGSIPDIYRESSLRRFEIISTISLPFTAIHGYLVVRGIEMARRGKVAPRFSDANWLLAGGLAVTFSGLIGYWDYLHTHNDDILDLPNLSEQPEPYSTFNIPSSKNQMDGISLASLSMKF